MSSFSDAVWWGMPLSPSTPEAKAGGSLNSEFRSTEQVPRQSDLQRETLSLKQSKTNKQKFLSETLQPLNQGLIDI